MALEIGRHRHTKDPSETRQNAPEYHGDAVIVVLKARELSKRTNMNVGIGNLLSTAILIDPNRAQSTLIAYGVNINYFCAKALDFEKNSTDSLKFSPDHEPQFNNHAKEAEKLALELTENGTGEIGFDHLLIGIVRYLNEQKPAPATVITAR